MPRITLAAPYTDGDGKKHKAGSTVDVDRGEQSRLKFLGLGRDPEAEKPKAVQSPASDKKKEA